VGTLPGWRYFNRGADAAAKCGLTTAVALMAALSVSPSGASATTASHRWSPPIFIGAKGSSSSQVNYSISCPSTAFCVSVNGDGGVVVRRRGVWSSPRSLPMGGSIDAVSCSSQVFCVAVAAGVASVYNGRKWSDPTPMGPSGDTYHVSCPARTFCAAVGASGVPGRRSVLAIFDGHSWRTHSTSSSGALKDRLLSVSCASSQFCMAANFDGQILRFNGSKWSSSLASGPQDLTSVSCTVSRLCMAVTITGESVMFHNGRWTSLRPITAYESAGTYSISCSSATECSVIGLGGKAATWTAGHWSSPSSVFPGGYSAGVAISCSKGGKCVAVNDRGMSASR